jgi:hypothetical protein
MEEKYWHEIPGGTPLTVRLWRDRSRLIFIGSQYLPTKNNPQEMVDDSIVTIKVCTGGFGLVVLVFVFQVYRFRRRIERIDEMTAAERDTSSS